MKDQTDSTSGFGEAAAHRLRPRAEAADFLNVSVSTLERWAREGYGPTPIKIGPRRIAYRISDLLAFLNERAQRPAA